MTKFKMLMAAAAAALTVSATAAQAGPLLLTPSAVIGSSGSYPGGFAASSIFDQQTGSVSDVFGVTYWINPDNGPVNAYITVDLGAAYSLASFELFNTHNSQYGDRGTGAFTIIGGNSVFDNGGGNFTLSGPTSTLVDGALVAAPISNPIAGQTFASTNAGYFRYLQFLPTSVASINAPCCGTDPANHVYGLAELRVSAVPESATWAMMLAGFGMVGFGLRRRSRQPARVTFA